MRTALLADVEVDIRSCARRCLDRYKVPIEASDVAQEMRLVVWRMAERWDPQRAKWRTFVRQRLPRVATDVMRRHGYVRRDGRPQNDVAFPPESILFTSLRDAAWSGVDAVDWDDLVESLRDETVPVQMFVLRAIGASMADIGRRYDLSESRVSQVLSPKGTHRADIVARLRWVLRDLDPSGGGAT